MSDSAHNQKKIFSTESIRLLWSILKVIFKTDLSYLLSLVFDLLFLLVLYLIHA